MLVYGKHLKEGKKAALAPSSFSVKTTARVLTGSNCCVCCYVDIDCRNFTETPNQFMQVTEQEFCSVLSSMEYEPAPKR